MVEPCKTLNLILRFWTLIPGETFPADADKFSKWKGGDCSFRGSCKSLSSTSDLQNYTTFSLIKTAVFLQDMGTEMPCTDRSPSPTIPTSGKIYDFSSYPGYILWGYRVQSSQAQALHSLCSTWTQTWRYQGGGSSGRLSDSECSFAIVKFITDIFTVACTPYLWFINISLPSLDVRCRQPMVWAQRKTTFC